VLLKPNVARDGDGIEFFADKDALRGYLESQDPEKTKNQFIIQEFLEGTVFGVNVLAKNGKLLAISAHRGLIPNSKRFAAAGATVMVRDEKIFSLIAKLVSTMRWSGLANLDTLDDSKDGQLKILELNPRFWASLRNPMGAGMNFAYMACLAALDESFTVPEYEIVRYFHPKTALSEAFRTLLGKGRVQGMTFQETGLRYLIKDPVAELIRAFEQEVLERESTVQTSRFFFKDQK
jgi:predicted ATP-grasp superfamily ATP-dependent carboligase